MKLSDKQEDIIGRWISSVETGTPEGDYGCVTVLSDNPKGQPQITYGFHQTTESGGNLKSLIKNYLSREDADISDLSRSRLIEFSKAPMYSMVGNVQLKSVLERSGNDPVMQDVQNEFFLEHYMAPARSWAEKNGFTLPLSMLVIYDSFVQSGGIPSWIRKRFRAVPPAKGGDEKEWIAQYINARHQWLKYWGDGKSGKSMAIRASRYRTDAMGIEIARGNWDLSKPDIVVNGIKI